MNWRAFANGFSAGLFIVVLFTNWDNIGVIRFMAAGVVLLYAMLVYSFSKREENIKELGKKEKMEETIKKAWEEEKNDS